MDIKKQFFFKFLAIILCILSIIIIFTESALVFGEDNSAIILKYVNNIIHSLFFIKFFFSIVNRK